MPHNSNFMGGLKGALGEFPNFYAEHSLCRFKDSFSAVTIFLCFDTQGHIV